MLVRLGITEVGGYRLMRHLGEGKVADVYEGLSAGGEQTAIKLLRQGLSPSLKAHDRLAQEAAVMSTLSHVNILRFHAGGLWEGRLWIAVELVHGSDLRRLADQARGPLPLLDVVSILRQVCEAVHAAHRRGILHRDLKPENILVTPQGVAKVADFGDAKLASWGVKTTVEQDLSTARYRAPETVRDRRACEVSDVFSIGVILYELLGGTNPVSDVPRTVMAVSQRLLVYQPPAPLYTLGRGIPFDVSELVQRALATEPGDRPSARELADGLDDALQPLLARRRASAHALPWSTPEVGLAKTEPSIPAVGQRGTLLLPAASSSSGAPFPPTLPSRTTTLPPVPTPVPVTLPSALPQKPPAVTVPMAEVVAPLERRTTGIPVEQAVPRPSAARDAAGRRKVSLAVAGAALLLLGIAGAAWMWAAPGEARPASAPSASAPSASAPSASAPAPRPPSASAPAPRPPPRVRKLPR